MLGKNAVIFVCKSSNWRGAAGEDVQRLVGELEKVK
jgi:hypothetical protein